MTIQFPTRISIPADHRATLVERLNTMTAATIDLYGQVKQAHWNIKGPQFVSRHELFDTLAARLLGHADNLAERVSSLGGYAEGTARRVAERSFLPPYDTSAIDGRAHIRCLVERYATYTARIRDDLRELAIGKDPASQDLLTEVLRGTEQDMWFLESHINV